jgi:anti-sigma B factor antagonist
VPAHRTALCDEWVMSIELDIESRTEDGWTVLEARGELDLYTAPKLRDEVLGIIDRGDQRIAIDLNGVGFIDSTGLGILVACLKRVREREGRMVLIAPESSPLRRLLSLTGLEQVLPTYTQLGDAVGA